MTMSIILDARTANDHFPGIGRYVVNLARALHHVAPNLDLKLLVDPAAAASRLALPDLTRLACPISPFTVRQQWRVPQMLRAQHTALYHSPYYLMPYRAGVPMIFTCHDLIPLIKPDYYTFMQRLIFRLTHWLALHTTRVTIAVSESTRRDLLRFFRVRADRIVVVPEAVDAHFTPQAAAAIDAVRQKYALPDRYVLYFGSNKPHKNLPRLVAALFKSEIHLVIAGQWDARYPEAKRLAAQNERVQFIGPVNDDDLPALYSGARLFVFPSLYEGFGLPVLEAMACGAPVACSHTSSLPEVIGEAGVSFDPLDVQSIGDAIAQVIDDRDLQLALHERGLQRAAQFTWERTAQQTLGVYQSILAPT